MTPDTAPSSGDQDVRGQLHWRLGRGGSTLNTIIIIAVPVLGVLLFSGLAACALAIIRFPGWRLLYWLTFTLLMLPSFLLLITNYLQISALPAVINDPLLGIILPSVAAGLAFSIVVLRVALADPDQPPRGWTGLTTGASFG